MGKMGMLVSFRVDDSLHALPLEAVARVLRAAEVTAWPDADGSLIGMIDVEGQVLPVVSGRRRLGLADRSLCVDDQFIVVSSGPFSFVLVTDQVVEIATQRLENVLPVANANSAATAGGMTVVRTAAGVVQVRDPAWWFTTPQPPLRRSAALVDDA